MVCIQPKPYYPLQFVNGANSIINCGDGSSMKISWHKAYPDPQSYNIAYNIYYSNIEGNSIKDGVKFVVDGYSDGYCIIRDFKPGESYYFIVRATEFDPQWYNLSLLPQDPYQTDPNIFVYPESLLRSDISATDLIIPVSDVEIFPAYGIIEIGYELI